MSDGPLLSICIVNWNTREDLARALESLACGGVEEREVIVVDNASSDSSTALLQKRFPDVVLMENRENLGFSRAYNQALRIAQGEYLLLLNPDCIVHPDALRQLVEFMQSNLQVGAAGPRLLNADGSLQFSCRRFPTFAAGLFRNAPLGWLFPHNRFSRAYLMADWNHSTPREVDWVSGAAICLRRQALAAVGGLDEDYFMYCEDVDWCFRAHRKGWKIFYLPTATITHLIGRASDQRPLEMVREFHHSMGRFYRKHYAARWPWALRWLPLAAIRLRMWITLSHHRIRLWRARPRRG